MKTKLCI